MTISRRGFIAGLALTGAAVPAAYYAHRQLTQPDEPITPGEASVQLAGFREPLLDRDETVFDFRQVQRPVEP